MLRYLSPTPADLFVCALRAVLSAAELYHQETEKNMQGEF